MCTQKSPGLFDCECNDCFCPLSSSDLIVALLFLPFLVNFSCFFFLLLFSFFVFFLLLYDFLVLIYLPVDRKLSYRPLSNVWFFVVSIIKKEKNNYSMRYSSMRWTCCGLYCCLTRCLLDSLAGWLVGHNVKQLKAAFG